MGSIPDWLSAIGALIAAAAAIATFVTALSVRKQLRLQRRQMKRDLENLYVNRYWSIMDALEDADWEPDKRRRQINRYFGLSEDQCDLRARRRITQSTWEYWRDGISSQLSDAEFAQALAEAPLDRYVHLRQLAQVATYDPN